MTQDQRDAANYMTALQGEHPHTIEGEAMPAPEVVEANGYRYAVRRVSMESLGVLQLLGSPYARAFADALNGQTPEEIKPGPMDSLLFAWVHVDNPDTVLECAMKCAAPDLLDPAITTAVRFLRGWPMTAIRQVMAIALGEVQAVQAAAYDMAAPEYGKGTKKNA